MTDRADTWTLERLRALSPGTFPGYVGFEVIEASRGRVVAEIALEPHHRGPNGYLHAGLVVTLADTCCGYGVRTVMPDGAIGFTTIELKANFLSTVLEGTVRAEATLLHAGRTTQVWDATVRSGERALALFRCTQLVLYPR